MISRSAFKFIVKLTADLLFIPLSIYLALVIRLESVASIDVSDRYNWTLVILTTFFSLIVFVLMGVYRAVVRYMGHDAFLIIIKSVTLSSFIFVLFNMLTYSQMPRTVPFLYWGLLLCFVGGSRLLVWTYHKHQMAKNKEHILIYGAGEAGRILLNSLFNNSPYIAVAFIDDNKSLQNQVINGLRVFPPDSLPSLISKKGISQIFLALPSIETSEKRRVIRFLEPYPVHVKTIPPLVDILSGRSQVDEIKELDIEDLLGRNTVAPDNDLLEKCIRNKVVLVTGAGGSIGSELCRQIMTHSPKILILFELSEFALYQIEQELSKLSSDNIKIINLLGSVQDKKHLSRVFSTFHVNTVYHAAAYKHVPLVEENIIEGIRNNVFGSYNAAKAAIEAGVETFVLISTDKAVRPTNIMGASKRLAEMILQSLSKKIFSGQSTRFCMVRFGNVLGSSGSVVPQFKKQIKCGGPVTVTHPEIIRYFMTIPEAVQLVLQTSAMGKGGDVFVLDMGKPVKIIDLARKMIHLSGLEVKEETNPDGDIEIRFTNLRPGEKLYEELLVGNNISKTQHPEIMRAEEDYLEYDVLEKVLQQLNKACDSYEIEEIITILLNNQIGYAPTQQTINDLLWGQQSNCLPA
jgi:FlaA1/EpsC-like NDP-sugar epimerase